MSRILLEQLSSDTYDRLDYSVRFALSQSEETITDVNLLDIAVSSTANLLVEKVNKRDESISGVDWEWWVRLPGTSFRRYAVQAKKLSVSGKYLKLDYWTGQAFQYQLLLDYALANSCEALYCFYNFPVVSPTPTYWNCCDAFDENQFGCTVVPAERLNASGLFFAKPDFEDVHSISEAVPWRCLLCPIGRSVIDVGAQRAVGSGVDALKSAENFGPLVRADFIHNELPSFLRQLQTHRGEGKLSFDMLPPELYSRHVGVPKRICVIDAVGVSSRDHRNRTVQQHG